MFIPHSRVGLTIYGILWLALHYLIAQPVLTLAAETAPFPGTLFFSPEQREQRRRESAATQPDSPLAASPLAASPLENRGPASTVQIQVYFGGWLQLHGLAIKGVQHESALTGWINGLPWRAESAVAGVSRITFSATQLTASVRLDTGATYGLQVGQCLMSDTSVIDCQTDWGKLSRSVRSPVELRSRAQR